MHKVPGLENPADLATKHLTRDKIDNCCGLLGFIFVDGRSATTAILHSISCEYRKWRFPTAVRSHGKELGAGPDPVGKRPQVVSSGDDRGGGHGVGEAQHWQCVSSTHWRGTFRGARSHRSPSCAGISWGEVTRMTTRASPGNQMIRDVFPRRDRITERAACSSIGGSSDIVVDVEIGVPLDDETDDDSPRRLSCSGSSLCLSGGRAEHVPPRERLTHINRYRQNILARIVPGNPSPLIPHCAFCSGTLGRFDPCVSSVQCETSGGMSQASHSAGAYRINSIHRFEPAAGGPDSVTHVHDGAFAGQGAAENSKAKTAVLLRSRNSVGNRVESRLFSWNLSLHGLTWSSRVATSHEGESKTWQRLSFSRIQTTDDEPPVPVGPSPCRVTQCTVCRCMSIHTSGSHFGSVITASVDTRYRS